MNEPPRALRCAIYTRKSTEEGLEQEFNSLQAQREAAEAFIASQRQAGWSVHPEGYDDGGYGGATLERPALGRLLAALERGEMDCVVVYKVDRLSRSLLGFAHLMGVFERLGVSFVSVTQQFATTTSLGRLTLNILLSFAQFERELIGERTRDKVSAARRKGKWMGGIPVLGYDVDARGGRLVVNGEEAERVRRIFGLCAEAGTLSAAVAAVNAQELGTKGWTSRKGRRHRSHPFGKAGLARLLGNVLYKGLVSHKGTPYPGEQEAIVEAELWDEVNRQLQDGRTSQAGARHSRREAPLRGLLRCACGAPMVATCTRKAGRRHEYYVCSAARKHECERPPVAVRDLEPALNAALSSKLGEMPDGIALRQTIEGLSYDGASRETTVVLRDGCELRFAVPGMNRRGVRSGSPVRESPGRVPRVSRIALSGPSTQGDPVPRWLGGQERLPYRHRRKRSLFPRQDLA